MTSDKLLEGALNNSGLPVKPYEYKGSKDSYIIYNEEAETLVNYADDRPQSRESWWQVHIFLPQFPDFRGRKRDVEKLLVNAGFTIKRTAVLYEPETETDNMHIAISCFIVEREEP